MANRLLLQTLVKFRDEIKSGSAKVQDVVTDYFNSTGKQPTADERSIILNEFNEFAPSNVEDLSVIRTENLRTSPDGQGIMSKYTNATDDIPAGEQDAMMEKFLQGADRTYAKFVDDALVDLQNASPSEQKEMIKSIIGRKDMFRYLDDADAKKLLDSVDKPTVGTVSPLRGDESFDELLDLNKAEDLSPEALAKNLKEKAKTGNTEFDEILDAEFKKAFGKKESKEGLGSLYPKGKTREIFDASNAERDDLAGFMREMRKAGIKNEDVMDVAKITDVAEGKRAATTLARAADMGADTKIKQEFLSDLDEKVMNNGPRYFQEEFQGYDSYGELIQTETSRIRNAVVDDLEALGVDEQKLTNILTYSNDVAKKNPYQPEAFIESIKQELEMNNIKYDMSFWENYISKILELSSKAEPRFAVGGLV